MRLLLPLARQLKKPIGRASKRFLFMLTVYSFHIFICIYVSDFPENINIKNT